MHRWCGREEEAECDVTLRDNATNVAAAVAPAETAAPTVYDYDRFAESLFTEIYAVLHVLKLVLIV